MANGIPTLIGNIQNTINQVSLLASDIGILLGFSQQNWGIYIAGTNVPAILVDSVVSLEFKKEYKISDYPIELGTFKNYNKVAYPFVSTIRLSVGSSLSNRSNFLQQLALLVDSTQLYDIVTPEINYINANLIDYSYRRTSANGASMIVADVKLMEIRTTATSQFSNTQAASDKNQNNQGQLIPKNTDTSVSSIGVTP